jgi:hypothetical protein
MWARIVAVFFGVGILAAVANTAVLATGGYFTPHAYVTLAIAAGVAFGSVVSGMAWTHRRCALAGFLVAAIVAGELYAFLSTAERLIISREAAQPPLRDREEIHTKAKTRVEVAQAVVDHLPTTSKRLETAETAKTAADEAVLVKSTDRGCRENCRQLLQAQVDAAGTEVEAARTELKQIRQHAEQELETARQALADIKAPESATPLADKIGVAAWIIDLVHSALGSVAANGLACCLIIFGAHHHKPVARVEIVTPRRNTEVIEKPKPKPQLADKHHAAQFGVECLDPEGEVDFNTIHRRYKQWCLDRGFAPLPGKRIAHELADLFDDAGIPVVERNGKMIALDVSVK